MAMRCTDNFKFVVHDPIQATVENKIENCTHLNSGAQTAAAQWMLELGGQPIVDGTNRQDLAMAYMATSASDVEWKQP